MFRGPGLPSPTSKCFYAPSSGQWRCPQAAAPTKIPATAQKLTDLFGLQDMTRDISTFGLQDLTRDITVMHLQDLLRSVSNMGGRDIQVVTPDDPTVINENGGTVEVTSTGHKGNKHTTYTLLI